MKIVNRHKMPPALLHAANASMYDKGDADVSVTELIGPMRIAMLNRMHDDQIEVDVRDMSLAMMGTSFHALMAEAAEFERNVVSEERITIEALGTKVSGQIDRQVISEKGIIIQDFKMTSVAALRKKVAEFSSVTQLQDQPDWVQQTNLYAYLVSHTKRQPIIRIEVIAFVRDWSRLRADKDKSYPQSPFVTISIRKFNKISQRKFLHDRVKAYQKAVSDTEMHGRPPPCSLDEMWSVDDYWTFGGRRMDKDVAFRLFQRLPLAEKARTFPQLVPGDRKRCKHYCAVAPFCSQFAEHQRYIMDTNRSIFEMAKIVSGAKT